MLVSVLVVVEGEEGWWGSAVVRGDIDDVVWHVAVVLDRV